MPNVHHCSLSQVDTGGMARLPPNASKWQRLVRWTRTMINVNPNDLGCKSFFYNRSVIRTEQRRHIRSRYNYIIHPFSVMQSALKILFFLIWTFKMLVLPVLINMMYSKTISTSSFLFNRSNMFGWLPVQLMVIVFFFFVGYINYDTKEIVLEHRRVVLRYLKTYFFFDLASSELVQLVIWGWIARMDIQPRPPYLQRVLHLFRYCHVICLYVRIGTVLTFLDAITEMLFIKPWVRRCLRYAFETFMYLHFLCCVLYFVPVVVYLNAWPEDSWLVRAQIHPDVRGMQFWRLYVECMLMTLCYFFGASSGKYTVVRTNEQIALAVIAFLGRLYTLFCIADVLNVFGIVGVSESNYEQKMAELKEYMVSANLPQGLRSTMVKYYDYKLQKRYFNEAEILNSLSDHLRMEIFLYSARRLSVSKLFKHMSSVHISNLISNMRLETFAPGDVIFKPDHQHDNIYFISTGTIAILNKEEMELCHLEDEDVFGLVQTLLHACQYYAVVIETTDLFVINGDEFCRMLEPFPEATKHLRRLTQERYAKYTRMGNDIKLKMNNCLTDLRTSRMLEKRRKRKTAEK
ncbi:hypothetical protein NQ315_000283 [Exocentrus adspersus]|uniref:Cyclic nucleotide-binding domain-containing protein n=1 Tax=Exocentrus adspersus TaxID=1586481 RepID=A0AAV8VQH5_9CUCU|nr:hypothetical protein NQ315_000283 [Exocentrus adspersus]